MKHILPFSLLLFPFLFSSCSADEDILCVDSDDISFVVPMPGVASRVIYDIDDRLFKAGFTVSAFCPDSIVASGATLPPHFEDKTVTRKDDGIFRSNECRWPSNAEIGREGRLKFFAFHPSRTEMKSRAGVGNQYFILSNNTRKDDSGVNYDYRLTKFRIAPDISKQVDFVTAIGEGNKTANLYSGIEIVFEHQLCGVDISVWGASSLYDIEVAGVRIGGTIVEADFGLSTEVNNQSAATDGNTIGEWFISSPSSSTRFGYVDYVFTTGDKVVRINTTEHNTADKAASIMGNGGKAMLIPYKHDKWDYVNDKGNSKNGMYFCSLIRMTEHEGDKHCIFPSTDPESQDHIVYLSVQKSDGTVIERLDKNGNIYGSDTKYDIPETEELRHYGWAAVPANVEWKAGYTYSYVLDYSKGVGLHDPADNNPASTVVDWGGVEILTTQGLWGDGEIIKNDDWGANSNNTAPDGTIWWK